MKRHPLFYKVISLPLSNPHGNQTRHKMARGIESVEMCDTVQRYERMDMWQWGKSSEQKARRRKNLADTEKEIDVEKKMQAKERKAK